MKPLKPSRFLTLYPEQRQKVVFVTPSVPFQRNASYSLFIPENSVHFVNGTTYGLPITAVINAVDDMNHQQEPSISSPLPAEPMTDNNNTQVSNAPPLAAERSSAALKWNYYSIQFSDDIDYADIGGITLTNNNTSEVIPVLSALPGTTSKSTLIITPAIAFQENVYYTVSIQAGTVHMCNGTTYDFPFSAVFTAVQ